MQTVYIFGAGASAAEGAPVVRNFLRLAYRYFKEEDHDPDLEIVWEYLEHFYGYSSKISCGEDLDSYPGIDEIFNIVDWYLLHNQAFSRRFPRFRLHDLKKALVKLISMTLDRSLPPQQGIHQSFVAGVIKKENELPAFISMNYDIVLDKAIRAAGYKPEYGFYGRHSDHLASREKVPLYKLHGSLNWSLCPLCGEISEHQEKVAHLLFQGDNTVPCLNCREENSQAVIIAPTLYKSYEISRLQNIWDSAGGAISRARRLVIIGYSLDPADTSIIATIKRALNTADRDREIIVINPNKQACQRYKQIFGEKCLISQAPFSGQPV